MTNETLAGCMTLLKSMNSGKEVSWKENAAGLRQIYTLLLRPMDDEIGRKAVEYAVLHEEWRPAPAKIREIAARLASPLPNEGDCFVEFWKAVKYSIAVPRWSHPVIGDVVRRLGGWADFEKLRPHLSDQDERSIWFARFMKAWAPCASEWIEDVACQIALPANKREPRYGLTAQAPQLMLDAPPLELAMPEFMREVIGSKGMDR